MNKFIVLFLVIITACVTNITALAAEVYFYDFDNSAFVGNTVDNWTADYASGSNVLWVLEQDSDGGKMLRTDNTGTRTVFLTNEISMNDFVLDFDFIPASAGAYFGIAFRFADDAVNGVKLDNTASWLMLRFTPKNDGRVELIGYGDKAFETGKSPTYQFITDNRPNLELNKKYHAKISAIGQEIKVWFDNDLVMVAQDPSPETIGGRLAIVNSSGGCAYDNISLKRPDMTLQSIGYTTDIGGEIKPVTTLSDAIDNIKVSAHFNNISQNQCSVFAVVMLMNSDGQIITFNTTIQDIQGSSPGIIEISLEDLPQGIENGVLKTIFWNNNDMFKPIVSGNILR